MNVGKALNAMAAVSAVQKVITSLDAEAVNIIRDFFDEVLQHPDPNGFIKSRLRPRAVVTTTPVVRR